MRTAVLSALLLAVPCPAGRHGSVAGKPEEVGLSSERLQRITQMIQRRIAAGDLAGAVLSWRARGESRISTRRA